MPPSPGPAAAGINAGPHVSANVSVPGGIGGVGFDDLGWAPGLGRILVPSGRTGNLALVSPKELATTAVVRGFATSQPAPKGGKGRGHDVGVTSADEGGTLVYATDRSSCALAAVDPKKDKVIARTKLGAEPDHVRWVPATGEVWVTEPGQERIAVFSASRKGQAPKHLADIPVKGGPESLVIDSAADRAYVNLWQGKTVALAVRKRAVIATWDNGCMKSRGLALDAERHRLFVGCGEGKVVALDTRSGKLLSTLPAGDGVDAIAYSPRLRHLYVPGGRSATLTIAAVADDGKLTALGSATTAPGAHCVATNDDGMVFVCDPAGGDLLVVEDLLPAR